MGNFIFSSPGKYVQGSGVLDELGHYLSALGSKAFLIADDVVWGITGERVQATLKTADIAYRYERFNGEASGNEILRLARVGPAMSKPPLWSVSAAAKRWIPPRRSRMN